jgi:hypothetical protein
VWRIVDVLFDLTGTHPLTPIALEIDKELSDASEAQTQASFAVDARLSPREARKVAAQAQKARERALKQDAARVRREQERDGRRRQREQELAARSREREESKRHRTQARGGFAEAEVCVVMEDTLAATPLGVATQAALAETFLVVAAPQAVRGLVTWTQRDFTRGGAAADGDGVQVLPVACLVFAEARALCELLTQDARTRGFPALAAECKRVRSALSEDVQLHFVFVNVLPELNRRLCEDLLTAGVAEDVLDEVVASLLVQHSVECILLGADELPNFLCSMTTGVAKAKYKEKVTGLHCVVRRKCTTYDSATPLSQRSAQEQQTVRAHMECCSFLRRAYRRFD